MHYLLIHHKVADYEQFRPVFDEDAGRRRLSGSKGGRVFRSTTNPNEVVALFEWDDVERARAFAASYELREAVEWATAVGEWSATTLEEVEQVDA
jgi:hypothetical protein